MLALAPLLAASLLAAAPASAAPAGGAGRESPIQIALRLASARHPGVAWRVGDARWDDVTYDGVADLVLLGAAEQAVVVAVVEGPVSERSRLLSVRFPAGVAGATVCGSPRDAQLNSERPDPRGLFPPASEGTRAFVEAGADAGGVGLVLVHAGPTGYCDALHVLYDGAGLAWWRPAHRAAP